MSQVQCQRRLRAVLPLLGSLLLFAGCSTAPGARSDAGATDSVAVIDKIAPHSKEEFLVGGGGYWCTVIDFTVIAPVQLAGLKLSASYDDRYQPIAYHDLKVGERIRLVIPAPQYRAEMDLANMFVRLAN